jgi:hypothetical protein
LFRWWLEDYHFRDVIKDVLATIHPRLLASMRRVKRALFGISPSPPGSLPPLNDDLDQSPKTPTRETSTVNRVGGHPDEPTMDISPRFTKGGGILTPLRAIRTWLVLICGGGAT